MALTGMSSVLGNIAKAMSAAKAANRASLQRAVLLVKRRSQELCPVDTGNLINSHETEVIDLGTDLVGEIRVTADYALHVHEAPPGTHFRKPGASSKFLEKALYEEQKKVADILIGGGKL